nr:T9SS type A sorting domain-containing protein [uncultured Draconibacterium sp.]
MKNYLLLICLIFCAVNFATAQQIELTGKGVLNMDNQTLTFTDPASIDMVVVEAACIFEDKAPATARFYETVGGEDYEVEFNYVEQNLSVHANGDFYNFGYFTATFNDVDASGISLEQLTHFGEILSFTAYVYRNDSPPNVYSLVEDDHAFVFNNGSTSPLVYEFNIPASATPRNIEVVIPFSDLESNFLRWANVTLKAGTDMVESEFQTNNEGELLRLEKLQLSDVPGNVTTVSVEIYSPEVNLDGKVGDSFITGSVLLTVEETEECADCEGQITTLDLEFLGDETDATVAVYASKYQDGHELATFYNVNNGDILSLVGNKNHGKMGPKIFVSVNGESPVEIHTSCSQPIYAGMTFGDFLIVEGTSHDGGELCYNPIENEDPPQTGCSDCEGQITMLELEYLGEQANATINVYESKFEADNIFVTLDNVNSGDIFTIDGVNKHDKMGPKIFLTINDGDPIEIHTSCSQPIYAGMTFGDFLIVSGASHDGGMLCDYPVEIQSEMKSASINVTDMNTGVEELLVYPNPVSGIATISFNPSADGQATVDLYNSMGQKTSRLLNENVSKNVPINLTLNANDYAEGMYILIVQNGSGIEREKINIIR